MKIEKVKAATTYPIIKPVKLNPAITNTRLMASLRRDEVS